jgi:hypothetical protein
MLQWPTQRPLHKKRKKAVAVRPPALHKALAPAPKPHRRPDDARRVMERHRPTCASDGPPGASDADGITTFGISAGSQPPFVDGAASSARTGPPARQRTRRAVPHCRPHRRSHSRNCIGFASHAADDATPVGVGYAIAVSPPRWTPSRKPLCPSRPQCQHANAPAFSKPTHANSLETIPRCPFKETRLDSTLGYPDGVPLVPSANP